MVGRFADGSVDGFSGTFSFGGDPPAYSSDCSLAIAGKRVQ